MPKRDNAFQITWTTRARQELWEIVDGLFLERSPAAERWHVEVVHVLEDLQAFPEMGRVVPEFHQITLREILLPPYRMMYHVKKVERTIQMLTVFHSRRILPPHSSE